MEKVATLLILLAVFYTGSPEDIFRKDSYIGTEGDKHYGECSARMFITANDL
jgi:hypothetical protein